MAPFFGCREFFRRFPRSHRVGQLRQEVLRGEGTEEVNLQDAHLVDDTHIGVNLKHWVMVVNYRW